MPETFGWLTYVEAALALIYCVVWLSAPRKWLFTLLLLIYAVAMVFIADGVRAKYGSSNFAYAALDASAAIAFSFVVLLPIVEGIFRLLLLPLVSNSETRSRLADRVYWLAAGFLLPFVLLYARLFARISGAVLMPVLLGTSLIALATFLLLRGRASPRGAWLYLPGYALGAPIMLAASLYYGAQVLSSASALAHGASFCIESGSHQVTSLLEMTPLTLISREYSEYHAELIVEKLPIPETYNWSWQTLSFGAVKPDMYYQRACARL